MDDRDTQIKEMNDNNNQIEDKQKLKEMENTKKRPRDDGDDTTTPGPVAPAGNEEQLLRTAREENKRRQKCHREQKRRKDVNKGFDDLLKLLLQIDPGMKAEAGEIAARKTGGRSTGGLKDVDVSSQFTRVDLINRTVVVMDKLYRENMENKRMIIELSKRCGGAGNGSTPAPPRLLGTGGLVGSNAASDLAADLAAVDYATMMVPVLSPLDGMGGPIPAVSHLRNLFAAHPHPSSINSLLASAHNPVGGLLSASTNPLITRSSALDSAVSGIYGDREVSKNRPRSN